MTQEHAEETQERQLPPPTVPPYTITTRGFDTDTSNRFSRVLGEYIAAMSCFINLERLDGVTVAIDYPQALAELDRGFDAGTELTPTTEGGVGVAMTPPVLRDGVLKGHIVLNAGVIVPIEDRDSEL